MGEILRDQLVIDGDTKNLMAVRDFIGGLVRRSRLGGEEENKVILAVDEAVSNIIEHGYETGPPGSIEIEIEADEDQFKVLIRDSGKVFDPETVRDPEIVRRGIRGRKRGLGIFLMRQVMDEVRYKFQEGLRNELTLVKYIR